MSSSVFIPPAPSASARNPRRAIRISAGSVIAVAGATAAIAGAAIFGIFGSDGVFESDRDPLTTATSALVSDVATIDDSQDFARVLGDTTIRISADAAGGDGVFVGVARAADVNRYLAGAQVDEVTDLDINPLSTTRNHYAGTVTPAPPAEQDFWVARSRGTDQASIDWKVRDGDYRIVLMNADASRGVVANAKIGIEAPYLPGIGIALLIAGGLLMAGGAVTAIRGVRS
jgi:hypothetical protein